MLDALEHLLRTLGYPAATVLLLAENALILALAVAAGQLLGRSFAHRRVAPPPPPLSRREGWLALMTVLLNTGVTVAGLVLWRAGMIVLHRGGALRALRDVVALLLIMDVAMYVLHRVAHIGPFFTLVHREHHGYEHPRPLTLFALHPLETLGFGTLWLIVLILYPASWLGMASYLTLNVVYGVIGHLGVEPLPAATLRIPLLKELTTSTFHAQHHLDRQHNFGFYTLLWDRLFGTLAPQYERDFGKLPGRPAARRTT